MAFVKHDARSAEALFCRDKETFHGGSKTSKKQNAMNHHSDRVGTIKQLAIFLKINVLCKYKHANIHNHATRLIILLRSE